MAGCLGIITARGGSKSITRKNVATLCGKPLIEYTCRAALGAGCLDRVVLSTDDDEIAGVAADAGVEAPFRRPAELASDEARSIDAVLHAMQWLKINEKYEPETMVLLQPTSPLRTSRHIDEAVELYHAKGADTVVSVVEVPHSHSPYSVMMMRNHRLEPFWTEPLAFDRFRKQEQPKFFARNGPAILISDVPSMLRNEDFYGSAVYPYVMSARDSIDIDSIEDLEMAEALMTSAPGA